MEVKFDFQFPQDEIFLVVRVEWNRKVQSRFVLAPDPTTAIDLANDTDPEPGSHVSLSALSWNKLKDDAERMHQKWKEACARN